MKILLSTIAVFGCVLSLSAELITGFEGYTNSTQVIFRQPSFSGSTSGNLDTSLYNFSGVTNVFPAGNANAGLNVYNTIFSFKPSLATPWLRLTSNGAPNVPNPTIDFNAGLSFDIYSDRPISVALLLRETSTTQPIGGNGGTSGGIEFIGGVPSTTNSAVSRGYLVPANTWTTVLFNIRSESVTAFAGTTANGTLDSTTGKGVLEALGFSTDPNGEGVWNIYLDNLQVVPEPSVFALVGLGVLGFIARARRQRA